MLRVEIHLDQGRPRSPSTTKIKRIYPQSILDSWRGSGINGMYETGLCLTSLPHRKLKDDQAWERNVGPLTLIIEPGRIKIGGGP